MMKKISKLLVVTMVALFMWIGTPNAIRLTMDEITDEVLTINPDVSYIYIIGKHIFTDKSMPLSLADFMLAARTIDVSNGSGNIKGDPIYDEMSTLLYEAKYNVDYEIVGFNYGERDLTGKGTPKDTYDIDYIDYHKLTEKNSIIFDIDGKTTLKRVEVGKTIQEPAKPEKEGYKFLGWYVSGTNNVFDFNTPITKNLRLEAKFEINKYNVVLKLEDDSTYDSFTIEHGKTITEPTTPTKEDYEFLGWFVGNAKYDFKTIVTSNVELVAKYRALVKTNVTTTLKDAIKGETQEFNIVIKANDYKDKIVKQTLTFSDKDSVNKIEYYDGTKWQELNIANTITVPTDAFALKDVTYKFRISWKNATNNSVTIKLTDNTSGKTYSEVSKNIVVANKKYKVTFNNSGTITSEEVVEGAKVTPPTPNNKTGYDFVGWYNGDTKFDLETPITNNITLTAKYELKTYIVKYLVDENTFLESEVKHGAKAVAPTTKPTKEGYTFKNWTLNGAAYDFNKAVTGNLTLTASFTINTYTVTFKNGSTTVATKKVNYNSTTTAPTSPSKTGYTFAGWYNGDNKFENTTKITGNVTYTAKFNINTYTVTFKNADGSTFKTVSVNYKSKVAKPSEEPTKEGHTFAGWLNGTTAYNFDTAVTGNLTLTPKFTANKYTVTFKNGDTTFSTATVSYGSKVAKPANNPTQTGHKFKNWLLNGSEYDFNKAVTGNITLTANFEINKYTVTFKDGETVLSTATVNHGSKVTKPTNPTKTGYTFAEWLNGTTAYNFDTAVTGNLTLTAKFNINTYTVTFKNGEDVVETKNVQYNKTTTAPTNNPTKAGYTFVGWYNGDSKFENTTKITDNVTFTAKFEKSKYTVTFKDGETVLSTATVTHDDKVAKPAEDPKKTGYTFVEWLNGTTAYNFDTAVTGNLTLTAKFNINKYTVTFKNGEEVVETKKVEYNKTTTAPTSPTKTGYDFKGWYNGDTKFTDTTKITANVTYTAKFAKKEFTIKFDSQGGTTVSDVKVKYNESLSSLPKTTRTGYKFLGWYDGDTKITTATKFTANKTLKAKWEENNDPVTDVSKKIGTYVTLDDEYQIKITSNSYKLAYEITNLKYNSLIASGETFTSGSAASSSEITINFYENYIIVSDLGGRLSNSKYLEGKYYRKSS